jgi:hypothetical protein
MVLTGDAAIAERAIRLRDEGKVEESRALLRTIPLDPGVALGIKELDGLDALLSGGWNLTAAEAFFGKEFLEH